MKDLLVPNVANQKDGKLHTAGLNDTAMCDSSPHYERLFNLHPPTPQEFPEFLKGDFAYHPLEIQSGFGTLKTKEVNTNSISYENTVESYYNSAV